MGVWLGLGVGLGPTALVHFDHDIAAPEELALHIDLVRGRGWGWVGVGTGVGLVYLRYGRPARVA